MTDELIALRADAEPDVVARVRAFAHLLLGQGGGDFGPGLVAVRDGRVLALATHPDLRDLLSVAGQMAAGYDADALALLLLGALPTPTGNAFTSPSWAPGDAALGRDVGRAGDPGEVGELLLLSVMSRSGVRSFTAQAFALTADGAALSTDVLELEAESVERRLAHALAVPGVDPGRMPVEPERARVALDVGTTRVIDQRLAASGPGGSVVLLLADDEAVARHRAEGLLPWQYVLQAQT